jgi:OmpA-OmpF porin, OOP family
MTYGRIDIARSFIDNTQGGKSPMKAINIKRLSALVLVAPLSAIAQPADQGSTAPGFDDRFYISPFATYTWADTKRETDNNWGFGLAVGKPLNEWFNLELRATHTELSSNINRTGWAIDGKNKVTDVGLDGLFFFSRGRIQPFLLAGVGAIYDNYKLCVDGWCDSASQWGFMAEAGAGLMIPVNDHVSFRVDGRYRYDGAFSGNRFADSSSVGDWMVTAGVVIPLGSRAAPPPKVTKTYELSADALFDFNQSSLKPAGRTTIDNFSRDLDQVNFDSIRIAGHTDPIGSQEYNLALSDRRANTVREELVNRGVPGDRITARGYGKSNLKVTPADCAHTKSRAALIECYQPNRRVDIAVEGVTPKE